MNKLDKIITNLLIKSGDTNPYIDKSDWSLFDYLVGYGAPLAMLVGVILLIFMLFE